MSFMDSRVRLSEQYDSYLDVIVLPSFRLPFSVVSHEEDNNNGDRRRYTKKQKRNQMHETKRERREKLGQPERHPPILPGYLGPAKPKEEAGPPSLIEECISNPIAAIVCCVLIGLPTLAVVLVLLPAFIGGYTSHTRDYSPSSVYQSNSPYAPSARTSHDIDKMPGTAAEKAPAKDAVRHFNEAGAKRGDRPTGL